MTSEKEKDTDRRLNPDASGTWMERITNSLRTHEAERDKVKDSLPRYEIIDELGRGGMGVVYRAWDPQLGREVALKVLLEGAGSAEGRQRFLREAQLASRLNHPNIVSVYDTGEWMGQAYLALQIVEGPPLHEAAKDLRSGLALIRDAARALHHAHQHGIVHRDVKPSNLLVDREGKVFVSDFGLARKTDVAAKLTLTGVIMGTPPYMSPEQVTGNEVDARADVYSLGATMYEMLTGKPPFLEADIMSTLRAVTDKPVPSPRTLNPSVPSAVQKIILKALEKERLYRYESAEALADDIQRYLEGESIRAAPAPFDFRVRRAFSRNRWKFAAAAALLAFLVAGGFTGVDYLGARNARDRGRAATDRDEKIAAFRKALPWFPELDQTIKDLEARKRKDAEAPLLVAKTEAEKEAEAARKESELKAENARLLNKGRKLIEEKKLPEARKVLAHLRDRKSPLADSLEELLRAPEMERDLAALLKLPKDFPARFADLENRSAPRRRLAEAARAYGLDRLDETWLKKALALGSSNVRLFRELGRLHIRSKNWPEAQKNFEKYRNDRPAGETIPKDYAELFVALAAQAGKDWKKARALLDEALLIDNDHTQAIHDYGLARFHADGQAAAALGDFQRAAKDPKLKINPEYAMVAVAFARSSVEANVRLERAEDRDRAWREALGHLDRVAARLEPVPRDLLVERGRMLRRLSRYDEAMKDAVAADAARLRGQIHYLRGEYDKALAEFTGDPNLAYWRGVCLDNLEGRGADALGAFRKAIASDAARPDAAYRMALHLKGDPARVVELATHAVEGADRLSVDEFIALRGEDKALTWKGLSAEFKKDALYLRAQARFDQNALSKCVEDCRAVTDLDAGFANAVYLEGYAQYTLYRESGREADLDAAIDAFSRTLGIDPKHVDALVGRGTAYGRKKDHVRGMPDLERAVALKDDHAEAWLNLGSLRKMAEDKPGAARAFRAALKAAPPGWRHEQYVRGQIDELER